MAENNSSAPLKTAEGAALPDHDEVFEHFVRDCDGAGIQYDGPSYEQGFLSGKVVGMDAAQAVAAQAPAELPVKSAITIGDLIFRAQTLLSPDTNDSSEVLGFVEDVRGFLYLLAQNSGGLSKEEIEVSTEAWLTPETKEEAKAFLNAAFLSASSPGTQAAPAAVAGLDHTAMHDALLWLRSALDCKDWHWSPEQRDGAELAYHASIAALPATEDSSAGDLATESVLIEGVAYTIPEPVALELLRLNIELQLAEVQAEPVAWLLEGGEVVEFEPQSYHAGDEWTPLYTAPQAQPADALDAERWRKVIRHVGAGNFCGDHRFTLWAINPVAGANLMRGSTAEHFTVAIDAAMAAAQEGGKG